MTKGNNINHILNSSHEEIEIEITKHNSNQINESKSIKDTIKEKTKEGNVYENDKKILEKKNSLVKNIVNKLEQNNTNNLKLKVNIDSEIYDASDSEGSNDDQKLPLFNYKRITQLPKNFFNVDPISTCLFHENYFFFATHTGLILITDTNFKMIKSLKLHRASILSIDSDGKYFATGSMDGTVAIGSILDEKELFIYDFHRPIHFIVLDKDYIKNKSFITGGMSGKIIYSTRNWIGKRSDIIIYDSTHPIVLVYLLNYLIFWANENEITVYSFKVKKVIYTVKKPKDTPRGDYYWPRLFYSGSETVIVAWANYIWFLKVNFKLSNGILKKPYDLILQSTLNNQNKNFKENEIEIENVFKLNHLICGVSHFKDNLWLILTYQHTDHLLQKKKLSYNVDLRVLNSKTGLLVFDEEICLKNNFNLGLNDFLLSQHQGQKNKYFIISPKDGIIANEFLFNDKMNWYLIHKFFYKAWKISKNILTFDQRLEIGLKHVETLISSNNFRSLSFFLKKMLNINQIFHDLDISDNKKKENDSIDIESKYLKKIECQWIKWFDFFIKKAQIIELINVLPLPSCFKLPKVFYNRILSFLLNSNFEKFCHYFELIDFNLYNISDLEYMMKSKLKIDQNNDKLKKCMVNLYNRLNEFKKSVTFLLELNDNKLIFFLSKHNLIFEFIEILPKIIFCYFNSETIDEKFIALNQEKFNYIIDILVEQRNEYLIKKLVFIFSNNNLDILNFFYLEKLNIIDENLLINLEDKLIQLYCLYNKKKLFPFLKKKNNYNVDKAIKFVEFNDFFEELVYLLGKKGDNINALMIIINKLNNPLKAIEFLKQKNSNELWDIFIKHSLGKTEFIKALIEFSDEQTKKFYDPITILKDMSSNVPLKDLNLSITNFLSNIETKIFFNQLVLNIVNKEYQKLYNIKKKEKLKGIEVRNTDFEKNYNGDDSFFIIKDSYLYSIKSEKDFL